MKKFDISELAKKISRKFPQTAAVFAAVAAIFLFFGGAGKGAENGEESPSANETRKISLDGKWTLKFWPQPDSGALRTPRAAAGAEGAKTVAAKVPGNVELDLLAAGLIPDPEKGDNSYKLREYEGYQWMYSRKFPSPGLKGGERAVLKFGGIDTFADIFLNGEKIGEAGNMLIPHSFDITERLSKSGDNSLDVIIRSAVMESNGRKLGAISSAYDSEGVRKAPHMYGWDIMPRLLSAGIWKGAGVEILKPARIDDIFFMTVSADPDKNEAVCAARIRLSIPRGQLGKLSAEAKLSLGGKTVWSQKMHADKFTLSPNGIRIKDAKLWWPRGYGESPLYSLEVRLLSPDGKILDSKTRNVGLRTVGLERSDVFKNGDKGKFEFRVNGRKIYIKGTNWTPLDALHSRDPQHLKKALEMAADLNCNMLRCWGGNVYESDAFYDFCDENGILVWQDFSLACTTPPQDDAFAKAMEEEARSVVERLRGHPCVALWAGNNENDQSFYWLFKSNAFKIDPAKERVSREVFPRVLFELDPTHPYLPSSPYYSPDVFEDRASPSEVHLWGPRGYYKAPYYTSSNAHFVSEIGYHGCPNRESLEKMFDKKHLYPWTDAEKLKWNAQWQAKAVTPFQSNIAGEKRNYLMTNQISKVFGEVPRGLDEFIAASQIVQAEAKKYFIEFWRTGRPYRCGILWWNLRDGWPILSDAVVDYYFSKKLAYYYIKRAQENAMVSANDDLEITGVNDSFKPVSGEVRITDAESGEKLFEKKFKIPANGKAVLGRIAETPAERGMLLIEYEIGGRKLLNHYLYGKPPFALGDYLKWQKALKIERD